MEACGRAGWRPSPTSVKQIDGVTTRSTSRGGPVEPLAEPFHPVGRRAPGHHRRGIDQVAARHRAARVLAGARGSRPENMASSASIVAYMMMPGDEKVVAERLYAALSSPPKFENPAPPSARRTRRRRRTVGTTAAIRSRFGGPFPLPGAAGSQAGRHPPRRILQRRPQRDGGRQHGPFPEFPSGRKAPASHMTSRGRWMATRWRANLNGRVRRGALESAEAPVSQRRTPPVLGLCHVQL